MVNRLLERKKMSSLLRTHTPPPTKKVHEIIVIVYEHYIHILDVLRRVYYDPPTAKKIFLRSQYIN